MKSYRVYVLQNPKGSFYIGFTENIPHRIEQQRRHVTLYAEQRPLDIGLDKSAAGRKTGS
jgi:predicted GIY-YIG superfamily endonuclease